MTSKTLIHELLYYILLEIREEAYIINSTKIFHLADLFHNVPLGLNRSDNTDIYDNIIEQLMNRAKEKGCEEWLERKIQSVKNTQVHYIKLKDLVVTDRANKFTEVSMFGKFELDRGP